MKKLLQQLYSFHLRPFHLVLFQSNPKLYQRTVEKKVFRSLILKSSLTYQQHFLSTEAITIEGAISLRNTNGGICWNCRKTLSDTSKFFCAKCKAVLPVSNQQNHFTLFGLHKDFQLPISELQTKFKSLQKDLHPDRFSMKSDLEAAISESVSSQLNKAYFILLKPLSRGLYMLELEGMSINEEMKSDDTNFLLEIMEINEEIASMTSTTELRDVHNDLTSKVDVLTQDIAHTFRHNAVDSAKNLLVRFKYYDNILDKLKERLPPV